MHSREPVFTYSVFRPFTRKQRKYAKNKKKKNKKKKQTGDSRYIYQNELDKFCFQHDMVSGDF